MPKETKIRVVAPATLEEGYQFDILVQGEPYTVTVPPGGIEVGKEFEVSYHPKDDDNSSYEGTLPVQSSSRDIEDNDSRSDQDSPAKSDLSGRDSLGAPIGRWRYHVCACCDVLTQATFWMALCCTPVLLAQLVTRLRLNWRGQVASTPQEASLSFNRIVLSFIAVLMVGQLLPLVSQILLIFYVLVILVYSGSNLRRSIRERYEILPALVGTRCCCWRKNSCLIEDAMCMCCCGCCALIQMARQTHNDKEYPGYCCTTTGLELDAPDVPFLSVTHKKQ